MSFFAGCDFFMVLFILLIWHDGILGTVVISLVQGVSIAMFIVRMVNMVKIVLL